LQNCLKQDKVDISKRISHELLITTHSPFIISDCKPEQVFIFEKGKQIKNPDFNTLGASVNLITEDVFNKIESISDAVNKEIIAIKQSVKTLEDIDWAKSELMKFGESIEKFDAYNFINKKKKELEQKSSEK
jgi:predicted ATP-binding protein involved in virulence